MRVAVIGRGSAGSLAAATVSRKFPDHTLYHIYDSRIPVIGVGEGTLIGLVHELKMLTNLDHDTIQSRLNATRKMGIQFEGWGRAKAEFLHRFFPVGRAYGYHLSADTLVELLSEHTNARHIDARVTHLRRVGRRCRIEFDRLPPEHFDLVFDARGFPSTLNPRHHIRVPFIPTDTAMIRRGAAVAVDRNHAYTRAVARRHGWIFVIPLTCHTSYGYIFNRHAGSVDDVERDFDRFLQENEVGTFEKRGVISFPNFIHRRVYDGVIARIGNAGGFMEPLEATALSLTQTQIKTIVDTRLARPPELIEEDAPIVNQCLVQFAWKFGIFISWHYSQGSVHTSDFWSHAREVAWPQHRCDRGGRVVDARTQLRKFEKCVDYVDVPVEWKGLVPPPRSYAGFGPGSFHDLAKGMGIS